MKPTHHPSDDLLLGHAAGRLSTAAGIVMASHTEACPRCSRRMREFEALGGIFLTRETPATLRPDALNRALSALDASESQTAQTAAALPAGVKGLPPLPGQVSWPRALAGCRVGRWRWIVPGIRFSRVLMPHGQSDSVFLLRIAPGKYLPPHRHRGLEYTQVLCGSFHDGRAHFGAGDFDCADSHIHHQPVVQAGGDCVCLAAVEGGILFDSFVARQLGAWIGM